MNSLENRVLSLEARAALTRKQRIEAVVNGLIGECRLTALEAPQAVTRAMGDETYLDELSMRPQMLPGNAPLNTGVSIVGDDVRNIMRAMQQHIIVGPQNADRMAATAAQRSQAIGEIYRKERERILPVVNAAVNTVDAALKRVLILNETVRAFATRVAPLKLFCTSFNNVPLAGTNEVSVPHYPLQTAASSDMVEAAGYVFDQASTTNSVKITVNKRKYQPLDYSSAEFRRQPYLDVVRLGQINAEKLGVDVFNDVWSVVTAANFGNPVATIAPAAFTSDDVIGIKGECTKLNWPEQGRGLIVNSDVETALQKDSSYKLALNIGGTEVIRDGRMPRLSGFDFVSVPNLPGNNEKLIGAAVYASGILAAFAPIDPAPGVRNLLMAYEVVTDPATGISFNYRHWGDPKLDRDFEVIECAYGYQKGVAEALRRICQP